MKKNSFIKTCHWEITKRCNLACIHCISSSGDKRELNTKQALYAIKQLKKLGCQEIYITGGEPLIRKDLFTILEEAKKNYFYIGLITNGLLINKKNIQIIKLYVDELGISLEGSSSQINDKIRGKGTFKKILKTIDLVKSSHIPITLYITLNGLNLSDFGDFLRLISSLDIKQISINEISLKKRAYRNRSILRIPQTRKETLKKYLLEVLKKYSFLPQKPSNQNCSIDYKTFFLSSLGYIYPCIEIFQTRPSCHLGNIRDITSEKIQRYRRIFRGSLKEKCPYEEIRGNNFLLSLNNNFIKKCPVEEKICNLIK